MTTFGSYQKPKTVAALSFFVSAVSKTYPEIYIRFKTARKRPVLSDWSFSAYGYLEGGFERRLLASVRWTLATAVARPQPGVSVLLSRFPDFALHLLRTSIVPATPSCLAFAFDGDFLRYCKIRQLYIDN